jgi:hypothetical protein
MNLATVFSTFNAAEAQLIRSRLEAAGFDVFVEHELASLTLEGYSMAAGGILVRTPEDQAADARELIEAPPPAEPPAP